VSKRRPPSYYLVAGLDLREELLRLCRLPAFGGEHGPLAKWPPALAIRRASKRPRRRLGFAVPSEWRISVTAYPGIRQGDVLATLLHEVVHICIGEEPGSRRWHGREFKDTMQQAMREAYGRDVGEAA
jgi:SprT-like family protein